MQNAELSFRSVFLSDLHLGTAGCKTEYIQTFLNHVQMDTLYLVGDIFDLWVGAKAGKWREGHTRIVRTLLDMSKEGCVICFSPGNHDALFRRLDGADFSGIAVQHSFDHLTVDGKKLLVVHGDLFDKSVTAFKPLAWAAAWTYEGMTVFQNWLLRLRKKEVLESSCWCYRFKRRFKSVIDYFTSFEERITVDARHQGYDGVVCGHIHDPCIRTHENGAIYINTGDWVENCSAIVEHWDGRLQLLVWGDIIRLIEQQEKQKRLLEANEMAGIG